MNALTNSKHNAGCLIIKDEKFLAVKDGQGKWDVPSGKGEKEETPEQTAKRETREETGLEVEIVKLLKVVPEEEDKNFYLYQAKIKEERFLAQLDFPIPENEQEKIKAVAFLAIEDLTVENARYPDFVKDIKELFQSSKI